MPILKVVLDGDGALKDAKDKQIIHLGNNASITVTGLERGMASGKASAAFIFEIEEDKIVIAETSLSLLVTAVNALKARYEGQY